MKKRFIYLAMDENEIEFASEDKKEVKNYIENYAYEARGRAMEKLCIDDDATPEQLARADLYAETEGDFLTLAKVNITGLDKNDEVTLEDGTKLSVGDILDKLNNSEDGEDAEDDDSDSDCDWDEDEDNEDKEGDWNNDD